MGQYDLPQSNAPYTRPSPATYRTELTPMEEQMFQAWVAKNKVPVDNGPQADYDMRGFFRAMMAAIRAPPARSIPTISACIIRMSGRPRSMRRSRNRASGRCRIRLTGTSKINWSAPAGGWCSTTGRKTF